MERRALAFSMGVLILRLAQLNQDTFFMTCLMSDLFTMLVLLRLPSVVVFTWTRIAHFVLASPLSAPPSNTFEQFIFHLCQPQNIAVSLITLRPLQISNLCRVIYRAGVESRYDSFCSVALNAMSTQLSPGAADMEGEESLSPLEQEVLDEYAKLAGNLGDVSLVPQNLK